MPGPHRPAPKKHKPSRVTKLIPPDDRKRSTVDDYKLLLHCVPNGIGWKPEHLRRTFEHIFSESHEPLVSFPARVRERSRFKFTTRKVRSTGMVIARGPWMLHGLTLLDGDPDVVAIAAYPITVRYLTATLDHMGTAWRDHVPAVAVLRRDGSICFIDFEHDLDALQLERRTRELAQQLSEDCGASYRMMIASEILRQPSFYNRNLIHANRPRWGEADLSVVERSILEQPLPTSVEEVSEALKFNVLLERWQDEAPDAARPCAGIDVDASSVLRLAYVGKIDFDMSRPFGPSTIVSRRA